MHQFRLYTIESAPTESHPVLTALKEAFGVLPNVAARLASALVESGRCAPSRAMLHGIAWAGHTLARTRCAAAERWLRTDLSRFCLERSRDAVPNRLVEARVRRG